METTLRRYDIDWLRVIAIVLLLIYHIAIVFQPWGVLIGFLQNDKPLEGLWVPMSMLNVWRIPLLFFVSGMGVCFAMKKRNWKQLITERSKRILLPFLFGAAAIVPIHVLLWQKYYHQDLSYVLSRGHLWFLINVFIYVLLLLPLFYYLKINQRGWISSGLQRLFKNPLGLLLVVLPFIVEVFLLKPDSFEFFAMNLHGFFLGLLAFLFGFLFIYSGKTFWPTILKWRWMYLALASALFLLRYLYFQLEAPNYLVAIESCVWIFAVFGFAYKHLNRPSKILAYLSEGVYPIYIIHMVFIYSGAYFLLPLSLAAEIKLILLLGFTIIGCFVTYEFVIRRLKFLRPLVLRITKLSLRKDKKHK